MIIIITWHSSKSSRQSNELKQAEQLKCDKTVKRITRYNSRNKIRIHQYSTIQHKYYKVSFPYLEKNQWEIWNMTSFLRTTKTHRRITLIRNIQ